MNRKIFDIKFINVYYVLMMKERHDMKNSVWGKELLVVRISGDVITSFAKQSVVISLKL